MKAGRELDALIAEKVMGILVGGDWDLASEVSGWEVAAERWRDEYHKHLKGE